MQHFCGFFTGWHSAKESATCFRAKLSTVSLVIIGGALDISELGVMFKAVLELTRWIKIQIGLNERCWLRSNVVG